MPSYPAPPRAPDFGQSDNNMMDLIMRRGQIAAQGAQNSGNIWANALAGIGQTLGQGIQQYGQQQQQQRQQEGLRKRDAAWVGFVESGEWEKDPKAAYATTLRIWGPDKAPEQFKALQAASVLSGEKRDPKMDQESLGAIVGAMGKLPDPARARLWPQAAALAKRAYPELQLEDQYNPERWPEIEAIGSQLRGEKAEGYTLSPGQQRFGPDGQPVAAVPPTPADAPRPQVVGRSLVGPDGKVIYRDPSEPRGGDNEPLMAVMGPDNQPVYLPRSQAVGKRPASTREQGRPVTSSDAGRVTELDTSLDDLAKLRGTLSGSGATGTSARVGAALPDFITEWTGAGADAKSKQAVIDRVKQVIGKALEGGVLRKEDEYKYEKILPTVGNPPELVEAKLAGLETAIRQRRVRTLESLADAGYDTARFEGRGGPAAPPLGAQPGGQSAPVRVTTPAEAARLPRGTQFQTPDGQIRVVP